MGLIANAWIVLPAVLLAGALIGATGIGGVLLVPVLTHFGGVPLPQAIAAASLAFALPALVALRPLRRNPAQLITALVLFAGVRGLITPKNPTPGAPPLATAALLGLGVLVGVVSALTGTGGPVLLLPLLMLCRQPVTFAVVAAQAIQLPVALSSSAVHFAAGRVDWRLALVCGAVMLLGSLLGQRLSQRMNRQQLQRFVSVLLLIVGVWFCALLLT